jgi:hypothetical protein
MQIFNRSTQLFSKRNRAGRVPSWRTIERMRKRLPTAVMQLVEWLILDELFSRVRFDLKITFWPKCLTPQVEFSKSEKLLSVFLNQ